RRRSFAGLAGRAVLDAVPGAGLPAVRLRLDERRSARCVWAQIVGHIVMRRAATPSGRERDLSDLRSPPLPLRQARRDLVEPLARLHLVVPARRIRRLRARAL